jgi:hypothetical protein
MNKMRRSFALFSPQKYEGESVWSLSYGSIKALSLKGEEERSTSPSTMSVTTNFSVH